jgi:hypothetical protein
MPTALAGEKGVNIRRNDATAGDCEADLVEMTFMLAKVKVVHSQSGRDDRTDVVLDFRISHNGKSASITKRPDVRSPAVAEG